MSLDVGGETRPQRDSSNGTAQAASGDVRGMLEGLVREGSVVVGRLDERRVEKMPEAAEDDTCPLSKRSSESQAHRDGTDAARIYASTTFA